MGKVLRRLRDRYPTVHPSTRWRWKQDPDFPEPDMIAGRTEFYTDEALDAYDARRTARERAAKVRAEVLEQA